MKNQNKKVIVAFSGGVDSSTSTLLLRMKGFDVSAVFMRLTDSPYFKFAEERANKLAKSMDVPFSVLDLRKEFKKTIIDYFIKGYADGITPNPCVMCNKEIKFGLLLKHALEMKADYIATGHYVVTTVKGGIVRIYQSKDSRKDQSYFLWKLNQKQLSKVIFPVGKQTKDVTRSIAKENKLASASFPESQEVCFVKEVNGEYLQRYIKKKKGDIVDKKGNVLGSHEGIYFYTIGQRRGIGLAGGPYWVVSKNIKKNRLVVSADEKDLLSAEVKFKNVNWISGKSSEFPLKIKAKIRYGHKPSSGILYKNKVIFDKKQRAATPGQSIVFYKGKEMIGGGVIV
ncbi:MAG: tRNA 2-thiouridine(34) synthase MnmA [Minisyncoccales bacterium]